MVVKALMAVAASPLAKASAPCWDSCSRESGWLAGAEAAEGCVVCAEARDTQASRVRAAETTILLVQVISEFPTKDFMRTHSVRTLYEIPTGGTTQPSAEKSSRRQSWRVAPLRRAPRSMPRSPTVRPPTPPMRPIQAAAPPDAWRPASRQEERRASRSRAARRIRVTWEPTGAVPLARIESPVASPLPPRAAARRPLLAAVAAPSSARRAATARSFAEADRPSAHSTAAVSDGG